MKKVYMLFSGVILASSGFGGPDPINSPPKGWLSSIIPNGVLQAQGIDFITGNFVPFLIGLMIFLIIVLSLIFTVVGGIMLSMSGGNKEGTAKAKNMITYAIIGLVLGLSSFIILAILGNFFGFSLLGALGTGSTSFCSPANHAAGNC